MKLLTPLRRIINNGLYDISRKQHDSIPIREISELLAKHNMRINEDFFILTGEKGDTKFDMDMNEEMIANSWLVLSWQKLTTKWEVNAYLS